VTKPLPAEFLEQFNEQFNCWNRGDLDLMLDDYAEDAVFDVSAVFTDVEPMQGRKEIRRYWDTLRETWDNLRIDPLEGRRAPAAGSGSISASPCSTRSARGTGRSFMPSFSRT
jgi:ketosteroid isomerase-like protein